MTNKNWHNSKEYLSTYYNEVVKPKRKKKQEENKRALEKKFEDTLVVQRICPICKKSWEETLQWKPSRRPSVKKQCPDCVKAKAREHAKLPEIKEKTNARRRMLYAQDENLRNKIKQATYKWKEKATTLDK